MLRQPIRICVVTGTRAEYGLLRWVMDGSASHRAWRCKSSSSAPTCRLNSA
jgi:hypothetical protein